MPNKPRDVPEKPISKDAFDFLKKRAPYIYRAGLHFEVARLLDEFHAAMMVRDEVMNREALATNVRDWIEGLQPTDLRNRSVAELQDELQRRAMG